MRPRARVERTDDFALDGTGGEPAWRRAEWLALPQLEAGASGYGTRAKVLWSPTGFYALFDCEDRVLRCREVQDQADLYEEDVVEVFLQPEPEQRAYFEYELSPLDYELTLMIVNDGQRFHGWLPWKYGHERRCRHATAVRGGERKRGATVTGWTGELFIPFALLLGLERTPPTPGTVWLGNLFRIDYDDPAATRHFAWSKPGKPTFHTLEAFGELEFA